MARRMTSAVGANPERFWDASAQRTARPKARLVSAGCEGSQPTEFGVPLDRSRTGCYRLSWSRDERPSAATQGGKSANWTGSTAAVYATGRQSCRGTLRGQIGAAYQDCENIKELLSNEVCRGSCEGAKSAATLIALGADEIHMGLLGELGPIDPQIDNLPALGVKRALETLAVLAQQTPGASDMFADYLARTVRIDQIGYYERLAESAVQYAERLIRTQTDLATKANEIKPLSLRIQGPWLRDRP